MSTTAEKKLYLLSRETQAGYDEYRSCLVCAASEAAAKLIHPASQKRSPVEWQEDTEQWLNTSGGWTVHGWISPSKVQVKLVGSADGSIGLNSVVISSFNNG